MLGRYYCARLVNCAISTMSICCMWEHKKEECVSTLQFLSLFFCHCLPWACLDSVKEELNSPGFRTNLHSGSVKMETAVEWEKKILSHKHCNYQEEQMVRICLCVHVRPVSCSVCCMGWWGVFFSSFFEYFSLCALHMLSMHAWLCPWSWVHGPWQWYYGG